MAFLIERVRNTIRLMRYMFKQRLEQIVATGVAIEHQKKILLIKKSRGPYKKTFWCVPGGKPEPSESLEECARREVKEETGLNIELIKKISTDRDVALVGENAVHFKFHNYHARLRGGSLKPADDSMAAQWFEKNALKRLELSPPTKRLLKKMRFI